MIESTISVKIHREDTVERASRIVEYKVPLENQMSVIDVLQFVKENVDPSLSFNYSCRKQRCGSCAMMIDGKIALACYTPAKDGQKILPLPGFEVEKDLVVNWLPHEKRISELVPQRIQKPALKISKKDIKLSNSAMTCIECFSCVAACPRVELTEKGFAGPAASVMLASYLDKREDFSLGEATSRANLEYCTRCYACNDVCPAGINIVGCIEQLEKTAGESNPDARNLLEMSRGLL